MKVFAFLIGSLLALTCVGDVLDELEGLPAEDQVARINAKLANMELPDEDRVKLAMRKNRLQRENKQADPTPLAAPSPTKTVETMFGLKADAPPTVRAFYARCEQNKASAIDTIDEQLSGRNALYRRLQSANMERREKRAQLTQCAEEMASLTKRRVMLVRNEILCAPYIIDRTQSKQSLMPGMIGKSNGLFIRRIVGPTSAVVNFCLPRLKKGEATVARTEINGFYSVTTTRQMTVSDKVIDEPDTQDVLLEGIATANLYNGAVYDADCIVEIIGLSRDGGARSIRARVVDVRAWIQGSDTSLPAVQLTRHVGVLEHVKGPDGRYVVSTDSIAGNSPDRTFRCTFQATYAGEAGQPDAPVDSIELCLSTTNPEWPGGRTPVVSVLADGKAIPATPRVAEKGLVVLTIGQYQSLRDADSLNVRIGNTAISIVQFKPQLEKLLNEPILAGNMP